MKLKFNFSKGHYILLLIVILTCIYQVVIPFSLSPIIEGYQSYEDCVEQGYPLDFCLHVPVQSYIG
jgi:hypothetical protein